jgi:hypothetical protein
MQNSLQNSELSKREDVAESRVSFGLSSALALFDALKKNKIADEQVWGLANRIWTCCDRENHWVGDDLHNTETGELYAGNGNLWSCGSKLCPSCVAKASNRSRKELKLSLKNQKLLTGEMCHFITLTIPNPNLSLIQTRVVTDRIWTLFRKRDYFKQKVRGGSKSEEFTLTENGYHYHYHLLCVTRYLNFERFRREWTKCIKIVFSESNLPCEFKTKDGLALVEIKRLSSSVNGLKGAIPEVCKYVTKSDSWEKIPQKDLVEIASIKRFWRMFEIFGRFRAQRNVNVESDNAGAFKFKIYHLLLSIINEGFKSKDKRRKKESFKFLFRFCRGREVFKHLIENGTEFAILDTKQISDGEESFKEVDLPEKVPKRVREMNWRDYIEQNGLETYFEKLAEQVEKTRYARKCFLSLKYRFATFHTLSGVSFSYEHF